NQLFYLDQKVKHISTVMGVTNELYPLINKRYTEANTKRQQESDKRKQTLLKILLVGGVIILSASLGYHYYVNHFTYPKNIITKTTTDSSKQNDNTTLDRHDKSIQKMKISNRKKRSIKYHLNRFEKNEVFLEKKLTLALLAHKCYTKD